jgi:hypothetical protein
MFPDWFTKPEAIYRTILWFLGPLLAYFVGKFVLPRAEAWHVAQTLEIARLNLKNYRRKLDNPPSLFEQVALIVCFVPAPVALIFMALVLQNPPNWMQHPRPIRPNYPQRVQSFCKMLYLIDYVVFGVLGVYGVQAAYRLRHGAEKYAENYRAEVQKKIKKLLKKFPQLEQDIPATPNPTS